MTTALLPAPTAGLESPLYSDLGQIRAPRPPRRPDPWQPRHPQRPDEDADSSVVRPRTGMIGALTVKPHLYGTVHRKPGNRYHGLAETLAVLAQLGFIILDPTSEDDGWFLEPEADEVTAGPPRYDGSFGPTVRLRCREAGIPVSLPEGAIGFRRGYPGFFHVPSEDGEVIPVSKCEAIFLARTGKAEIIDELTPRGALFRDRLNTRTVFGVYY